MNTKKNRGFTLVELLVVVGILAVLGAVVFPTVQNALNKGREAAGLQNMRQLADALISYVSDTNGYPASETSLGTGATEIRQRWFNTLAPYIGATDARAVTNAGGRSSINNEAGDANQEVFNQVMIDPMVRGVWQIGENNSIGYNYHYLGNARSTGVFRDPTVPPPGDYQAGPPDATYTVPAGGRKGNGFINFPVFANEIAAPDRTIAFAYSDGTGYIGPYRNASEQYPTSVTGVGINGQPFVPSGTPANTITFLGSTQGDRLTSLGNNGFQIDPTFLPLRDINPANNTGAPGVVGSSLDLEVCPAAGATPDPIQSIHCQAARSIVTNRYDGGTVVAYCDGHVQYLKREAVYVDPRTGKPSNRLWNGFGRDNDENGDGILDALTETIIDNNEWVGIGIPGSPPERNTAITMRMTTGAPEALNASFLQGAPELLNPSDTPIRGGSSVDDVMTILQDSNGPTLPKVRPFPIVINVLGDTLVNTSPTSQ